MGFGSLGLTSLLQMQLELMTPTLKRRRISCLELSGHCDRPQNFVPMQKLPHSPNRQISKRHFYSWNCSLLIPVSAHMKTLACYPEKGVRVLRSNIVSSWRMGCVPCARLLVRSSVPLLKLPLLHFLAHSNNSYLVLLLESYAGVDSRLQVASH